jgi:N-sulfoglucosamine sulfohydrolase
MMTFRSALAAGLTASVPFLLLVCTLWPGACRSPVPERLQRPNILLCLADDISYPHMGAYGTSWVKTPAFDRVAREGLLFTNCYTPNAKCAPSRSCLLTGRNSWQLGAAANHWPDFPVEFGVYTEVLADNGYFVGYTGKGWAPGTARNRDGGPRPLTGQAFNEKTTAPPTAHISNNDYAANFEAFLDARPAGAPFCFWYGSTEPHRAYAYGAGIKAGDKEPGSIDRVPAFWPDSDSVRADMLDYAFEIGYFDLHLQRMLEVLERRGELANTLVVVTADNGMPFPRAKGQVYEYSVHLPLAIMWPQGIGQAGRTVPDLVSFIDFAPTFLSLAGVDAAASGMAPMAGLDMSGLLLSGEPMPRDHLLFGKERHDVGRPADAGYPIRAILQEGYLYIRNYEPGRWPSGNPETGYLNCDGGATKTVILNDRRTKGQSRHWDLNFGLRPAEELYYLPGDPDCVENLAGLEGSAGRMIRLREQMEAELRAQGDPRMEGKGQIFDEYPYMDAAHRNFYERYMAGEELRAGWVEPGDFELDKLR